MNTLSKYLYFNLDGFQIAKLLALFPDNEAVKTLKEKCPDAASWDLLAAALSSGANAILPKPDLNQEGIYPAIKGDS